MQINLFKLQSLSLRAVAFVSTNVTYFRKEFSHETHYE